MALFLTAVLALALSLSAAAAAAASDRVDSLTTTTTELSDGHPATQVAAIAFELAYDTNALGPASCVPLHVGCAPVPVAGDTTGAVFEFTPDSPHFADIAAKLTDGVPQVVNSFVRVFRADGTPLLVFGEGWPESAIGRGNPDLAGCQLDRIRLTLVECSLVGTQSGYTLRYQVRWTLFSTRTNVAVARCSWGALKQLYR